ncbi:DUF6843 domain-containing protein [Saccharibacillus alkalitolerans]|uniref:DUF6843 domain-containing protein n=1 Tax=Saccharibacillus alkalitolerans TaxID=2705290 RepID=A0ABX0FAA5_9BACL|nr:hypothetical protein [Saccharibacillus alkalitolerans]NGZ76899.1 hypothetical protein [Saccharibacillus alkalitolerans]
MKKIPCLLLGLLSLLALAGCTDTRPSSVYLLPEGYEGWVLIDFAQEGAPEIPVEDGKQVFRIGSDGKLDTSTPEPSYGTAEDEYYFVDEEGNRRRIENMLDVIQDPSIGTRPNGRDENGNPLPGKKTVEQFFVGPLEKMDDYPNPALAPS